MAEKEHLNIVFIGHVDHGKSTTIGRLLYDTGAIDEQTLRKYKEEAKLRGKETFEFAYVADRLKEERERGLTIDIAHLKFETKKYMITIIDAPGHKDFVKNMITGASQADGAILVVSAKEGIQEQTKEHLFLAKTLGINQLIVGINKMDAVNWDRVRYEEIVSSMKGLLKMVGYKSEEILFIPYSAWTGDNVVNRSENMPWYTGPTLLEALDTFKVPPKPVDKPLRIPIQDVYVITGHGTVPVGRVETGVLKVGDEVIINPGGHRGVVKSIEMHHTPIQEAKPGDNIGFNVKGVSKKDIRRGYVAGHPDNPPTVAEEFTAQIVVLWHPTAIARGYTPVFHIHTAHVACTIIDILEKKDPRTGQTIEKNPDILKTGDVAIVRVRPTRDVVVEPYKDFPPLGRFAIRDMGRTIGAGIVLEVTPKG